MTNYFFHPLAENELNEAIDYYNQCKKDLGIEFLKEIVLTIQSILKFPSTWVVLSKNTRRCLMNRFPYGIVYQIVNDEIYIIAVMQLNQRPAYWKKRK